jgi:protoporphyrin/coproporphyrin ferrochelatase
MSDAVLLLAFGGPTAPSEIRPFLENVVRGRRIPPERLEAVALHYEHIGGKSPLNELTFRQADALRALLPRTPIYVGMRNWAPYIEETLRRMTADGITSALGLVLSPHANEASRERYVESVDAARGLIGPNAPTIRWPRSWHAHPRYIDAVASQLQSARNGLPDDVPVVFTAHSVPVATANASPYVAELTESCTLVAARVGISRWQIAYQSRSGSPRDPWLEPDINDVVRALAAAGERQVVVIPIGFVCDHVEVLYDLDVEAQATAATVGIQLVRALAVNDHPAFIAMLAEVVQASA